MSELGGKVAAVTGAASGLGRAMALAFASEGMHLALCDIDEAGLARTRDDVAALGVKSFCMRVDVSQATQIETFAQHCVDKLKGIHLVCNNAGVAVSGAVWENNEAESSVVSSRNESEYSERERAGTSMESTTDRSSREASPPFVASKVNRSGLRGPFQTDCATRRIWTLG